MSLQGGKRKQETVQRIEDVGNILLSVQRELERVRGVLDRMPETDPESGMKPSPALQSLRNVLHDAEGQLRNKAEAVLQAVVDNSVNTLPAISLSAAEKAKQQQQQQAQGYTQGYTQGDKPNSPDRKRRDGSGSPSGRRRRYDPEVLLQQRDNERLMSPPDSAGTRQFVAERFGLAASTSLSQTAPLKRRKTPRTMSSGAGVMTAAIKRGRPQSAGAAHPLPRLNRRDPAAAPPKISKSDAAKGLYHLQNSGFIDPHADLTPALGTHTGLLQPQSAIMHPHTPQHMNRSASLAQHSIASTLRIDPSASKYNKMQNVPSLESLLSRISPKRGLGDTRAERIERDQQRAAEQQQFDFQEAAEAREKEREAERLERGERGVFVYRRPEVDFSQPHLLDSHGHDRSRISPSQDEKSRERDTHDHEQEPSSSSSAFGNHNNSNGHGLGEGDGIDSVPHMPLSGPQGPRSYNELLDTYSLHQFIIRKGKTLVTTPEFVSFRRKYAYMWGPIRHVIKLLVLSQLDDSLSFDKGKLILSQLDDSLSVDKSKGNIVLA